MSDKTKLENLSIYKIGSPDNPINRLARPISADDTTLYFEDALADDDVILGIKSGRYTELIYLPLGSLSMDSKSVSGVIRGVSNSGLDYEEGDSSLAMAHPQGALVANVVSPQLLEMMKKAIRGEIATGGNRFIVGREQNEHIYYAVKTATGIIDIFRRNTSGDIEWSNDNGASWNSFGVVDGHGDDANISAHAQVDASADSPTDGDILTGDTASGAWKRVSRSNLVDDTAFAASWDGDTDTAPSKNAIYDALAEAKTFFDSTDITGAEAETLTSSGDSGSLHYHAKKFGVDNWYPTSAASTKVITHNLGRVPKRIKITAFVSSNLSYSLEGSYQSIGLYNGTNYANIYFLKDTDSTTEANSSTSDIITVQFGGASVFNWSANIVDNSANSFTLDVNIFNSAQQIYFIWEVE